MLNRSPASLSSNLADCLIDIKLARLIPEALSRRHMVLVFAQGDEAIQVAMADPLNLATADDLQVRLGHPVQAHLAFGADISEAISRAYRRIRGPLNTGVSAPASTMVLLNGSDPLLVKANSSPVFSLQQECATETAPNYRSCARAC